MERKAVAGTLGLEQNQFSGVHSETRIEAPGADAYPLGYVSDEPR